MSLIRMEIKLQPQLISSFYFHITQKSKQAFYLGLALKNPAKKKHPIKPNKTWLQVVFLFFNFLFFEVFKSILYQLY